MSMQETLTRHSRHLSLNLNSSMDSTADKEERKREYNRLAQREFRRRRKEHLKNLEQAQKEQSSEQTEEIERLRYQNDELRRENEALKAQLYGPSAATTHSMMSAPLNIPSIAGDGLGGRSYSLSPSLSGASVSGAGSPPSTLGSDMMPMGSLSLTSSMLPPSMQAYADPTALSSQPYSMVHPSGLRHNAQSSPESSGYRSSRPPPLGPSFQPMSTSQQPVDSHTLQVPDHGRSSTQSSGTSLHPYDRARARSEILDLFRPLVSDSWVTSTSERHLNALRSLNDKLPVQLKPSKAQLETPHYYGIDLLPSPTLRDRLLTVTADVAQSFVAEMGVFSGDRDHLGNFMIWGNDALNETSWEFSESMLQRWGWLLGRDWIARTNYWRRQRGVQLLPDW